MKYLFGLFVLLVSIFVFTGCFSSSYKHIIPHHSSTVEALPTSIDGVWKNSGGMQFRIVNGKMYTLTSSSSGAPVGSLISKNISKKESGVFGMNNETHSQQKISYGRGELRMIGKGELLYVSYPNPVFTAHKGNYFILSNVSFDNAGKYLSSYNRILSAIHSSRDIDYLLKFTENSTNSDSEIARIARDRIRRLTSTEKLESANKTVEKTETKKPKELAGNDDARTAPKLNATNSNKSSNSLYRAVDSTYFKLEAINEQSINSDEMLENVMQFQTTYFKDFDNKEIEVETDTVRVKEGQVIFQVKVNDLPIDINKYSLAHDSANDFEVSIKLKKSIVFSEGIGTAPKVDSDTHLVLSPMFPERIDSGWCAASGLVEFQLLKKIDSGDFEVKPLIRTTGAKFVIHLREKEKLFFNNKLLELSNKQQTVELYADGHVLRVLQ